jgi:hypothetical protein
MRLRTVLIAAIAAAIMLVAAMPANAEPIVSDAYKDDGEVLGTAMFFKTETKVNNANYHLRACDRESDGHSVIAKLVQFGRGVVDQVVDRNGASEPDRGPGRDRGCAYSGEGIVPGAAYAVEVCVWDFGKGREKEKDPINRCTFPDESDFDTPPLGDTARSRGAGAAAQVQRPRLDS